MRMLVLVAVLCGGCGMDDGSQEPVGLDQGQAADAPPTFTRDEWLGSYSVYSPCSGCTDYYTPTGFQIGYDTDTTDDDTRWTGAVIIESTYLWAEPGYGDILLNRAIGDNVVMDGNRIASPTWPLISLALLITKQSADEISVTIDFAAGGHLDLRATKKLP